MWSRKKTRTLSTIYFISSLVASPAGPATGSAAAAQAFVPESQCDTALLPLFTPPSPQLGTYKVCTSDSPLVELAQSGWLIETVVPADAFGSAGNYDRARLARLYGGRRATVARGHIQREDSVESITLISPYPNPSLTRLHAGTLIILHRVPGV
jgi:hypothetical protein